MDSKCKIVPGIMIIQAIFPRVICVSYYISGYGWHSSQIQGTSDSLTGCTSLAFSTEEKS